MASKRELDPDYEDVTEQETKRQRILEEGAKEATEKRIENIIRRHFNVEIHNKEQETLDLSKHIHHARDCMDRLRACIVANYYSSSPAHLKHGQSSGQYGGLQPIVKKNLIGKAPRAADLAPSMIVCHPYTCTNNDGKISDQVEKSVTNASLTDKVPCDQKSAVNGADDLSLTEIKDYRESRFTVSKQIVVGNVSKYISVDRREPNDQSTHKWMVYVRGSLDEPHIHQFVKKVWFFLHPSYRPNDLVEISEPPFHLTRRGWGEFPVRVQLHFKDLRNKRVDIIHQLKLDKTYTGLQTLGAETVVEIKLDRESVPGYSKLTQIKREANTDQMTRLTNGKQPIDSSVQEQSSIKQGDSELPVSTPEVDGNLIKKEKDDEVVNNVTTCESVPKLIASNSQSSNKGRLSTTENNSETLKTIAMSNVPCVAGIEQESNKVQSTSNTKKICIKDGKVFLVPEVNCLLSSFSTGSLTQATVTLSNSTPRMQSLITSPSRNCSTSYPVISLMPKLMPSNLLVSGGVPHTVSSPMGMNVVQGTTTVSSSRTCPASVSMVSLMPNIIKPTFKQSTDIHLPEKSPPKPVSFIGTDNSGKKVFRLVNPNSTSCVGPALISLSGSDPQTHPAARVAGVTSASDTLLVNQRTRTDNSRLFSPKSPNTSLSTPGYSQKNVISLLPKSLMHGKNNGSKGMLVNNVLKPSPCGNTLKPDGFNVQTTNTSFQQQNLILNSVHLSSAVSQVAKHEPSISSISSTASTSNIPSVSEQFVIAEVGGKRCLLKLLSNTSKLSNYASVSQGQNTHQTVRSRPGFRVLDLPGNMSYINTNYVKTSELPSSALEESVLFTNSARIKGFSTALKESNFVKGLKNASVGKRISSDIPQDMKPGIKSILGLSKRKTESSKSLPRVAAPKREIVLSLDAATDMGCLMRMAVKQFPIVRPNVDRARHPYCAQSTEQWLQWTLAKRRASEWQRASAIRKCLLHLVGGDGTFKGQQLWTRKQIMYWCRQHAYSPHFLEPAIDQFDSSSVTMTTIPDRVNSYSLPVEYLQPLEALEANRLLTSNVGDEDIDIIGDDIPRVKVKREPNSVDKSTEPTEILAPHDSAEYVIESARQLGIDLDYSELEPGILGSVTHHMIYASMLAFAEDILREGFAAGSNDNSYPSEVSILNISQALSSPSLKLADFLTNKNCGVLPDGTMSTRVPLSR